MVTFWKYTNYNECIGVASPTSSISQRSFQGDGPAFHCVETRKIARKNNLPYNNDCRNNDATQDTNDTSPYHLRNRPQTTQGNNRRTGVQSPPPKFTNGGGTEGEFIIGDLGESFRNWEETTRSAIINGLGAHCITHLLPPCCF